MAGRSTPFRDRRIICSQLQTGTRLVAVLNVNQSSHEEINYGTGNAVADENMADAKVPLRVEWHGTSYVKIPVQR